MDRDSQTQHLTVNGTKMACKTEVALQQSEEWDVQYINGHKQVNMVAY